MHLSSECNKKLGEVNSRGKMVGSIDGDYQEEMSRPGGFWLDQLYHSFAEGRPG